MNHRYLAFAKVLIFLLVVGIPLMLYQSFLNYRGLVRGDAALQETLALEQDQLARQVTRVFFNGEALAGHRILQRTLPAGAIQGLAALPAPEELRLQWGITLDDGALLTDRQRELLWDEGRFPSGMPKRFAALVEICGGDRQLQQRDFQRLYDVASQFWQGRDLDAPTFGFLVEKLPGEIRHLFGQQADFLALGRPTLPDTGSFFVNLQTAEEHYLLALPLEKLTELNRLLRAFKSDYQYERAEDWLEWEDIQLTLRPKRAPFSDRFLQGSLVYLGVGMGAEIILWLIYFVLIKYEKINRTQRQLLATTSHELRTPLAVMRQFAEMLLDKAEHFPGKFQTYHQHIHRECLKMQFLVENLLSAARFENLKLAPSCCNFDLKPWLLDLIEAAAKLTPEQQIRCDCPEVQVCWDAALMSQVITNILENARVHAGTDIEVTIAVDADVVTIDVRDFGENDLAIGSIRAFKPGVKSASGLGLGLYLSQRIVTLHGGKLSLTQAEPGLVVQLALPLKAGA